MICVGPLVKACRKAVSGVAIFTGLSRLTKGGFAGLAAMVWEGAEAAASPEPGLCRPAVFKTWLAIVGKQLIRK